MDRRPSQPDRAGPTPAALWQPWCFQMGQFQWMVAAMVLWCCQCAVQQLKLAGRKDFVQAGVVFSQRCSDTSCLRSAKKTQG